MRPCVKQTCFAVLLLLVGLVLAERPQFCCLDKDPGPSRAALPRYYFNKKSGDCELFYYGGSHGNQNRFDTKEECEKTCMNS